jgi:hypothetical protein
VFKSTDGGAAWRRVRITGLHNTNTFVGALAVDPDTPTTLYAGELWRGVFKSTDGALSWNATELTSAVAALAIDPLRPARSTR